MTNTDDNSNKCITEKSRRHLEQQITELTENSTNAHVTGAFHKRHVRTSGMKISTTGDKASQGCEGRHSIPAHHSCFTRTNAILTRVSLNIHKYTVRMQENEYDETTLFVNAYFLYNT